MFILGKRKSDLGDNANNFSCKQWKSHFPRLLYKRILNWNFFQGNDNTRCNKINQMAAVRMAWYSLIFKHKSAFRSKSECLMNLDHQSWEIELWRNHILTSDCNFKTSNIVYYSFLKVFKIWLFYKQLRSRDSIESCLWL